MLVRETNEKLLLTSSIKHIAESLHVLHEVLIIDEYLVLEENVSRSWMPGLLKNHF